MTPKTPEKCFGVFLLLPSISNSHLKATPEKNLRRPQNKGLLIIGGGLQQRHGQHRPLGHTTSCLCYIRSQRANTAPPPLLLRGCGSRSKRKLMVDFRARSLLTANLPENRNSFLVKQPPSVPVRIPNGVRASAAVGGGRAHPPDPRWRLNGCGAQWPRKHN